MISKYTDEDLLPLSGIQHFAFCPRQWALIHIEKQWNENLLTFEGRQLHKRVDNPDFFEARGGILTARAVPVSSYVIGLFGVADIVEFYSVDANGITLKGRKGQWIAVPVEYKRGNPKKDNVDAVQLCAQAMCLEEMLCTDVSYGYIFYGETKHRTKILFGEGLREQVLNLSEQMHNMFNKQYTPKVNRKNKGCSSCSLFDICIPQIADNSISAREYIKKYLETE